MTRPFRSLVLAGAVAALTACGPDVYEARGVVRDVLPDDGQLVIEHEKIPGFMDAMTMSFDVSDPALLEGVEVGHAIDFRVEHSKRAIRVVSVEVLGEAQAVEASPLASLVDERDPAPDFSLVDQEGRPLSLADLRGRAVVLDFVFTHCSGPCPILTSSHVTLQRQLPPEVRERTHFVSISIDPARDTPQALRDYATARGADLADWSFLTGPVDEVGAVVERYGVAVLPAEDDQFAHSLVTFLIDPQGRVGKRYLGLEHEPADIARDLRALL